MNSILRNPYQPPLAPLERTVSVRAVRARFWYGYLLVLIALSLVQYVLSFTSPASPGTIQATLVLGACLLSLTPIAGYAVQRRLAFRWIWMLWFSFAFLVYCGLAMIPITDPSPRRLIGFVGGSIVLAPYLYAAFRYAFKCPHLWTANPIESDPDSSGANA